MNETAININDPLIELTTDIVSAYVSNDPVPVGDLPHLIAAVHTALQQQVAPVEQQDAEPLNPVVPIKKSVTPDYIVCLEDGKNQIAEAPSRNHPRPDEYRTKWGLPADYPMVAPAAPARRKKLGLKFS